MELGAVTESLRREDRPADVRYVLYEERLYIGPLLFVNTSLAKYVICSLGRCKCFEFLTYCRVARGEMGEESRMVRRRQGAVPEDMVDVWMHVRAVKAHAVRGRLDLKCSGPDLHINRNPAWLELEQMGIEAPFRFGAQNVIPFTGVLRSFLLPLLLLGFIHGRVNNDLSRQIRFAR